MIRLNKLTKLNWKLYSDIKNMFLIKSKYLYCKNYKHKNNKHKRLKKFRYIKQIIFL